MTIPRANRLHAKGKRGAAMLLVMVLLALMLILAVSFTFLMSQQEGTSVATLGAEQTRIVTRTGADHAYARLTRANRLNQLERAWGVRPADLALENDPMVDWIGEVLIDLVRDFEGLDGEPGLYPGLLDEDGNALFRVEDPRRLVLGLNVEDESGKVNLNFSNLATLANLMGSGQVEGEVTADAGVFAQVVLDDASFLTPYDYIGSPNNFGGGFIVIDNMLFSYDSRRGNVLFSVVANPNYTPLPDSNALFNRAPAGMTLRTGMFVTTPTPYKVLMHRLLNARGDTPGLFNNVGDIRRIAELPELFRPDVRRAPVFMGHRMDGWPEGIDPVTYQVIENAATTVASTPRYDGSWFYPFVVTWGDMVTDRETNLQVMAVRYDHMQAVQPDYYVQGDPRSPNPNQPDWRFANIGVDNLVRLRRSDGHTVLGWVIASSAGNQQNNATLMLVVEGEHRIGQDEAWVVEVAERAPVNVNTANFETLVALFQNIGPRSEHRGGVPITRRDAERIAGAIMQRTRSGDPADAFRNLNDLIQFLRNLASSENPPVMGQQVEAFLRQQRYPYAIHNGPVTMPVMFGSTNAYRVEALATRYQPAGGTRARSGFRELVQIGSDTERTFRWMFYDDFAREMRAPQGNILQLRPNGGRAGRQLGMLELPYVHYDTERHVRQWRAQPWTGPQPRDVFAMANEPDRFYSNVEQITAPSGASYQGGDLESGMFQFWYRRHWADMDANRYLFDVAEQEYSNRFSLLWWGDRVTAHNMAARDDALVLRIKDRSLHEAFTELRYELDENSLREDEWYHFVLNWKGTELSHINLLIDGRGVGRRGQVPIQHQVFHTFRDDTGAWVSRTSKIQNNLSPPPPVPEGFEPPPEMLPINPADVDAFPDRGVVAVGAEAIEYDGKSANALLNIRRGARGTNAGTHPIDSVVTEFGYTSPLRAVAAQDVPLMHWQPRFPDLPETYGQLESALTTRAFWRVSRQGSNDDDYWEPETYAPNAGFPGAGSAMNGLLALEDYIGLPDRGVLLIRGMSFRGYRPPGTTASPDATKNVPNFRGNADAAGPWSAPNIFSHVRSEYIVYDGITSGGLRVVARYGADTDSDSETFGQLIHLPEAQYWHFLGAFGEDQVPRPTMNDMMMNRWDFYSQGSVVTLVSIPVDDASGYQNRSMVQVNNEWMFYNVRWNPGGQQDAAAGPLAAMIAGAHFPALVCVLQQQQQQWIDAISHGTVASQVPFAPWRGAMQTEAVPHLATSRVTPVFGTTIRTGEEDEVTLVIGKNGDKRQHRIRVQRELTTLIEDYAYFYTNILQLDEEIVQVAMQVFGNFGANQYVCALYDHTHRTYPPNAMNINNPNFRYNPGATNLLKFPTGEMPVALPIEWTFNAADPRTQDADTPASSHVADFDSFEFRRYQRGDFRILSNLTPGSPGEGGRIRVNVPLPPNMSVLKINSELVAYRGFEVVQGTWVNEAGQEIEYTHYFVTNITRGILGTEIGSHSAGTEIMNMASLRVGRPTTPGTPLTNTINLIMGADTMRPFGFMRIEEDGRMEVLGYQKWSEQQVENPQNPGETIRLGTAIAGQYRANNWPQALFRGAYGTRAMPYTERALFFDQPVRFPDWSPGFHSSERAGMGPGHARMGGMPGASSPEISYVQGATTFRNSVFTRFRWRVQYAPLSDPVRHNDALQARVVIRFKQAGQPMPGWDEIPTNQPGGLFAFDLTLGGPNTRHIRDTIYEQVEDFTQLPGLSNGIRADRIEWRVYLLYRQGAYERGNYKATMNFQGAEVDVTQITRVLRHEQRR